MYLHNVMTQFFMGSFMFTYISTSVIGFSQVRIILCIQDININVVPGV